MGGKGASIEGQDGGRRRGRGVKTANAKFRQTKSFATMVAVLKMTLMKNRQKLLTCTRTDFSCIFAYTARYARII